MLNQLFCPDLLFECWYPPTKELYYVGVQIKTINKLFRTFKVSHSIVSSGLALKQIVGSRTAAPPPHPPTLWFLKPPRLEDPVGMGLQSKAVPRPASCHAAV